MIRNLEGLTPEMQELCLLHVAKCREAGLDVLIYCTLRTNEEQARLFRQGRKLWEIEARGEDLRRLYLRPDLSAILLGVGPQKGDRIRTWAGPGQSLHNYGEAYDGVPMIDGKPVWNDDDDESRRLWALYGRLAVECGLAWAGNWSAGKREMPHCQRPKVKWQDLAGVNRGT